MSFLTDIERRLDTVVNRIFRTRRGGPVQPLEIARAMARELEKQQTLSVDAVYVPNLFHVYLNPSDLELLRPVAKTLRRDAVRYVEHVAARRGYSFAGRVELHLDEDASLESGRISVRAAFREDDDPSEAAGWTHATEAAVAANGAEATTAADTTRAAEAIETTKRAPALAGSAPSRRAVEPDDGTTRTYAVRPLQAESDEADAYLEVDDGSAPAFKFPLFRGKTVLVGRASECDLSLCDGKVSKRHAEIRFEDGEWRLKDLGSTNGTYRNGRRVDQCVLRDGDELTLGLTTIHFTGSDAFR